MSEQGPGPEITEAPEPKPAPKPAAKVGTKKMPDAVKTIPRAKDSEDPIHEQLARATAERRAAERALEEAREREIELHREMMETRDVPSLQELNKMATKVEKDPLMEAVRRAQKPAAPAPSQADVDAQAAVRRAQGG